MKNLKQIPKFKNENEEAEFLDALKMITNQKDVPYQSLVKIFLDEKVKEEYKVTRSVAV